MALKITPGPLPKDGEAMGSVPGTLLEKFVEDTVITNFDLDNFKTRQGSFFVSSSEPPNLKAPGMLWFARGDGRLYLWHTQMPSAASLATYNQVGGSNVSLAFARDDFIAGHWVALSDRREIPGMMLSEQVNTRTYPHCTPKLSAGVLAVSDTTGLDANSVRTPLVGGYPTPYGGSTSAWGGSVDTAYICRFSGWGINMNASKHVMHTTGTTIAGNTAATGIFHELGYRRLGCQTGVTFGGVGVVGRTDMAVDSHAQAERTLLHRVDNNNPYIWNKTRAFCAVVTESGPPSLARSDAGVQRRFGFFLSSSPNGGWTS
jgi:hypothetical protein